MEKFHIKKISEINEKKLKEFYFKAFNFQKEIIDDHFWRYRSGHNNFEPLALIIEDKICGHAGLIPVDIKINNNPGIDLNYHSKNWSSLAVKLKLIINRLKCNQDKNNTIH